MAGPFLCVRCEWNSVLRPGDYCRGCASKWIPGPNVYHVVVPNNLDELAEETGIARSYLAAKSAEAFENYHYYVLYYTGGEWHEKSISDKFPVDAVMRNLFRRL